MQNNKTHEDNQTLFSCGRSNGCTDFCFLQQQEVPHQRKHYRGERLHALSGNISLDGPVAIDSVKLGEDGSFAFEETAKDSVCPDFYRLRIAGQTINLSIDSTETISVKAAYPSMSYQYTVEGSENCSTIKELSLKQMKLQALVNEIAQNPNVGVDSADVIIDRAINAYKQDIKTNYIFKAPMMASSYYALFQTLQVGRVNTLIFNPRNNKDDVKVFAAVATSWDTYYPNAERGKNLHNIAIQGMKDIRIIENQMAAQQLDASKVQVNGVIELALQDNKGVTRKLTDLKGKVVLLDFHLFAGEQSTKRIMMLRELYNKYHAAGFEIYQVSIDPDEHFWKTSTAALPWISVRDEDGIQGASVAKYNVQSIPTFFLIDRSNTLRSRDVQIKDLDAAIKALL